MPDHSDSIVGLYDRHARAWDADRGRSLIEKRWLDRFLALVPPGGAILDLGCGSGEPIARYMIESGRAVTGVDSSPSMIGICRSRFPDAKWVVADMRSLSLGRRFAGIVAWDSFFHLRPDDQQAIFATFREHAQPAAVLMFTSGPARGEVIGSYRGEPLYHASLDAAEYRGLMAGQGFEIVAHVADDADCGGHTVWLARLAMKPALPSTN